MREFRILHIIKGLGRGGAERLLTETIALHAPHFKFDVVYFLPHKNHLVNELEQLGCRVYLLPASQTFAMLFKIFALLKIIRKNNYQIIHCHLPWAGILGRVAAKFSGVPVVYTEHNNFFTYHRLTRFVHRLGFKSFSRVIAVSADSEKALRKAFSEPPRLTTILNGVNTSKFNKVLFDTIQLKESFSFNRQDFIISTVAVFRKQKRLDIWISIAKEILLKEKQIRFLIIGDGPLNEELRLAVEEASLQEYIIFTGLLEDPRPYLACTDVYLMSSDFEGLPIALLEAMSMGCTPVVTPVGGITDVVSDGQNGIVYESRRIELVSDRILELKKYPELLKKYAAAARERVVTGFSMTRMIQQLEQVYYDVQTKNTNS